MSISGATQICEMGLGVRVSEGECGQEVLGGLPEGAGYEDRLDRGAHDQWRLYMTAAR